MFFAIHEPSAFSPPHSAPRLDFNFQLSDFLLFPCFSFAPRRAWRNLGSEAKLMARNKESNRNQSRKVSNGSILDFEAQLWAAADKMRGQMQSEKFVEEWLLCTLAT